MMKRNGKSGKFVKSGSTILVLLLIAVLLTGVAAAATGWTYRQEQAHAIADSARAMGYGEDTPVIKIMQDIFALESGDTTVYGSYYYSARTGQTYKFEDLYGAYGPHYNADGSYYDGQYLWYLNQSTGYYYRYDENGRKVNGEKATKYGAYANRNLWNGLITDVGSYVSNSDADTVAKFILSYADRTDGSIRERAEIAWCLLNSKGTNTFAAALRNFEDYNAYADLTTPAGREALAIAKDVLFRYKAETSGNVANSGRVLPKDYTYMWLENYKIYFRTTAYGTNWNHSSASPY